MKAAQFVIALALACAAADCIAAAQAVLAVRPSGAAVPENLLRLSIVFAKRPERPVIPQLRLLRDDGSEVYEPFDTQELWSPDGHVLTVLFQPGRVKTGLVAHDTLGRALVAGEHVRLMLNEREIASWRVTNGNTESPDPDRWKIVPPHAGTRKPLSVELDNPVDAMDRDFIAVADPGGERVPGSATLSRGETRWSFVPSKPWRDGAYTLMINGELEDSSGNRVGQQFEHGEASTGERPRDSSIPFRIW
ncbi:hypothetical protein [Trinickia mobilis]|uniref:hypothetical protein n=1 Tax=Trinickia mobilis TaxID=2816356 RepID=UPI001A8F6E13|nr:hypothetical protein [Trinickia mobilis]